MDRNITPDQQAQIDLAKKRAAALQSAGHSDSDIKFALEQEGFHIIPRTEALKSLKGKIT